MKKSNRVVIAFFLIALLVPTAFWLWNEVAKVVPPDILMWTGICGILLVLTLSVGLVLLELGRTNKPPNQGEYFENLSKRPGVLIITKPTVSGAQSQGYHIVGSRSGRIRSATPTIIEIDAGADDDDED